ncbi:MAG: glycosyltransferase family 1 protein [Cyanobacteria bacterium P01_G01_bin.19]
MRIAILRRTAGASWSMDVYADRLIDGLKKVRPDWTIVQCAPASEQKQQPFWLRGIQKYYERYWRYPAKLSKLNADIFHIIDHSDGYLSSWLKRQSKSNIVTCHDLINLVMPETFVGRAKFPAISMMAWRLGVQGMKKADRIITVSTHTKNDTVEHLGICDRKIAVIPNAVDSSFRQLDSERIRQFRQQQGLEPNTLCLLNVGSNNARKNISTILKVVSQLKSQKIPACFWKVGADFNLEQKNLIKNWGLQDCITYLGQPEAENLVEIYNAADCLVAPSTYEGFGLTILEAMSCGTAVVTANVTSMPEVAGDAAILVPPLDTAEIAKQLTQLYLNPGERQELVNKGLERVKQFTWEQTAEKVARVYEQVVSAAKSSTTEAAFYLPSIISRSNQG